MKLPQLTLRDVFWLVLVAALLSLGIAREVRRSRHFEVTEGKLEYPPLILYPVDKPLEDGDEFELGMLGEGESVEVLVHNRNFEYTVRLKSGGDVVEKRFTVQARACGCKTSPAQPK